MEHKPYRRERQARWDRRYLRTISTHLPVDEALRFKSLCYRRNTTPYEVLQAYIRHWSRVQEDLLQHGR